MKTKQTDATAPANPAPVREHPPLPGGGSWKFNETDWKWESNDPVEPAAAAATTSTAEE